MNIRKIALHELEEFLKSDVYDQFEIKPITPARAASYLKDPHASPNNFVLYLLTEGSKLIAFRTLFADRLTHEKAPFAWLSGNWVHPDYRRQGFSEKLLKEAHNDWNGRLMFTNYAPASLQLYLKTGKFEPIYEGSGERFYLFAKTSKILAARLHRFRFILPIADFLIHLWATLKVSLFKPKVASSFQTELLEFPDRPCYDLVKSKRNELLFRRTPKTLKWIFNYPWISNANINLADQYPFSSYSKSLQYQTLKIFLNGQFKGFLVYSIRDGHLKILLNFLDERLLPQVAVLLSKIALEQKIEMMTVLDPVLSNALKNAKNPFVFHKKFEHRIYSSFKPANAVGKIQAGDGDFILS